MDEAWHIIKELAAEVARLKVELYSKEYALKQYRKEHALKEGENGESKEAASEEAAQIQNSETDEDKAV